MDSSSSLVMGAPAGPRVWIRPNAYEAGRAHIIVAGALSAATITVDLSTVLSAGDPFTLRNGLDWFGPPVATGTYTGAPIVVSTNALLRTATPVGTGLAGEAAPAGRNLLVMVVQRTAPGR